MHRCNNRYRDLAKNLFVVFLLSNILPVFVSVALFFIFILHLKDTIARAKIGKWYPQPVILKYSSKCTIYLFLQS